MDMQAELDQWHSGRNRDAQHNLDARACLAAVEEMDWQLAEEFSMFVFPI